MAKSKVFSLARTLREDAAMMDAEPSVTVRLTIHDVERLLAWSESHVDFTGEPLRDYYATLFEMLTKAKDYLSKESN